MTLLWAFGGWVRRVEKGKEKRRGRRKWGQKRGNEKTGKDLRRRGRRKLHMRIGKIIKISINSWGKEMKYTQRRKLKQKIRQEREIKDIRQVKKQLREEIKSGQKNKMQQKEDRSENEAWGGDETFYFDLTSSVNLNESHWNRYSTLALALSAWATNRLSTCCSKQNKLFKLFIELHPGEGCSWRGHLEASLHGHR